MRRLNFAGNSVKSESMQLAVSTVQSKYEHALTHNHRDIETAINSIHIDLDPVILLQREEPEYNIARLLSDIGGNLGFFLGFSAPTIILLLERIVRQLIRLLKVDFAHIDFNVLLDTLQV